MSEFQTATSENCAAIYRLRETSHLSCSGGGKALNLSQPDNQASSLPGGFTHGLVCRPSDAWDLNTVHRILLSPTSTIATGRDKSRAGKLGHGDQLSTRMDTNKLVLCFAILWTCGKTVIWWKMMLWKQYLREYLIEFGIKLRSLLVSCPKFD